MSSQGVVARGSASRPNVQLFELPGEGPDATPTPVPIPAASFQELGILEVQHLERWISSVPDILGEPLLVITNEFAGFDRTRERSDILALDRRGNLVVIELKRDESGRQDLQALRYAAYSSTLTLDDLLEIYVDYQRRAGRTVDMETATADFEAHAHGALLGETIDENTRPRIMLVARSFQDELVWTCLWLIESYEMDITCVQIVPYEVSGKRFLSSSVRIPLTGVEDYAIRRDAKRRRAQPVTQLDWQRVIEVVSAIRAGRWMSYADVAEAAGGSRRGAMAVGGFLANSPDIPPSVHRVLRDGGRVSPAWRGDIGGPDDCRALLESEGLTFDEKGRADPAKRYHPSARAEPL